MTVTIGRRELLAALGGGRSWRALLIGLAPRILIELQPRTAAALRRYSRCHEGWRWS